jgi:hypothetical protein
MMAYCWILSKAPTIREALVAKFDKFVDDPTSDEISERVSEQLDRKPRKSPTDILGPAAQPHANILKLVFPHFGTSRKAGDVHGERISKRRNLVRVLFLGNPPKMISRSEIERIWKIRNVAGMEQELRDALKAGTFTSLIDRLDDLLESLPADGDKTFWSAISRIAMRRSDWAKEQAPNKDMIETTASMLLALATRNRKSRARAKAIFDNLVAAQDLALAPYVFRKHLFQFGMTRHDKIRREGDLILNEEETRKLLEDELLRYKSAIVSGKILRRAPNLETVFAIGKVERWDTELKDALTGQLMNPNALATFATLIVPPGYSSSKMELERFLIPIKSPRNARTSAIQRSGSRTLGCANACIE